MSDIPRISSRSKRKKSEDHGVMQNLEASSLAILETTENTDDVLGADKKDGNSIDNDSPPMKKKRTCKPRIPIKDQPRETPCPVGQAVELGQQLQNFALHIVDSQSADERATQIEWLERAKAAKASLTAIQEMPSVAHNQGSNMPPIDSMQHFSTIPTHPIQSGQHYMAPPQDMSVPGSFVAPQYPPTVQDPPVLQSFPANGFMNPQGHPFQGISHDGPGPYDSRPQCPIRRLESTLDRVAAGIEANNRLIQQILAQGDQNTNTPVNSNR
ncbi:hypothetical protein FMUND_11623 [Fusarium mundagurra]|uniref:Uncharacterized protein n=1 Tax=Fusarium mundagurra TaxID=1567541 RepID=A0A8H5Y5J8_9HYPO|nr:hypothetical protein FMUND_11623 [Fusarium mundagurra]